MGAVECPPGGRNGPLPLTLDSKGPATIHGRFSFLLLESWTGVLSRDTYSRMGGDSLAG